MGSWFSSSAGPTTDDAPPAAEERDVEQPPSHPDAPEAEDEAIEVVQEDPFMLPPSVVQDAVFYANARNTPSARPHMERAADEQNEQNEQNEHNEQNEQEGEDPDDAQLPSVPEETV